MSPSNGAVWTSGSNMVAWLQKALAVPGIKLKEKITHPNPALKSMTILNT
jgi:hypothetical protein